MIHDPLALCTRKSNEILAVVGRADSFERDLLENQTVDGIRRVQYRSTALPNNWSVANVFDPSSDVTESILAQARAQIRRAH
jgi:hypothetical protein